MVELSTPVKSWNFQGYMIAIEGLQVQFLSVSYNFCKYFLNHVTNSSKLSSLFCCVDI